MEQVYTPVRLLRDMRQAAEETKDPHWQRTPENQRLANILSPVVTGRPGDASPLDLDAFLRWAMGPSFCKKSYDGMFKDFNERLLLFIRTQRKWTYKQARKNILESVVTAAVGECWEQTRQAYRFDKDFLEALMGTEEAKVPVSAFRRLPHRCFYLDLEGGSLRSGTLGMFVEVTFGEASATPWITMVRTLKPEPGSEELRMGLTCLTAEDLAEEGLLVAGSDGIPYVCLEKSSGNLSGYAKEDFLLALHAITYLSTDKPDVTEPMQRKPARKHTKHAQEPESPDVPVSILDVGVRYGAAIRKARAGSQDAGPKTGEAPGAPAKKRKPMVSHMRRAHWHRYRTGKGRTEVILKWIPPVFVSGKGAQFPVTVHEIRQ